MSFCRFLHQRIQKRRPVGVIGALLVALFGGSFLATALSFVGNGSKSFDRA